MPTEHPLRPDIDELLTDCLLAIDEPEVADKVLSDVLATPDHPFLARAAQKRLVLYADHRRPDELARVYRELEERGLLDDPTPDMAYAVGRARWTLGETDGARDALSSLPPSHAAHAKAAYFLAVIDVSEGDLDAAQARFSELAAGTGELADLATLALARLHYERRELDAAAAQYQTLTARAAPHPEALEELAWTHLQRGDVPSATTTIDRLIDTHPDHPSSGRMLLVLGRVAMTEKRWADAEGTFAAAFTHLERQPPVLPDDPVLRRAEVVHRDAREQGDELAAAAEAVERLTSTLRSPGVLARHTAQGDAAWEILARVAATRLVLLHEEVATLPGSARRELFAPLQTLLAFEPPPLATEPWVRARLQAIGAFRTSVRAARDERHTDHRPVIDGLHSALDAVESELEAMLGRMRREAADGDTAEHRELAQVQAQLARLDAEQPGLEQRGAAVTEAAGALGVADGNRNALRTQSEAAAGVADASWLRFTHARDARERAVDRRSAALEELDAHFARVRARMAMTDDPE